MNRRRLLRLAAPMIAMPYIRRGIAAPMWAPFQATRNAFPGQAGNQVGFAAAPGFPGFGVQVSIGTTLILTGGSPGSPQVVQFQDITPKSGQACNVINGTGTFGGGSAIHDVKFVGCRFTGRSAHLNSVNQGDACVDLLSTGSTNITFSYCTFAPFPSLNPNPIPAPAWPSASVGTGIVYGSTNYQNYLIPYANAYRDCIALGTPPGSTTTLDHCDLWGAGDTVTCSSIGWQSLNQPISTSCGTTLIKDCWLHDNRNDFAPTWSASTTYHLDDVVTSPIDAHLYRCLVATITGGSDPSASASWGNPSTNDHTNGCMCPNSNSFANVTFDHCTISAIGNTNAIAWQHLLNASNNFDATANYAINALVAGLDGFVYVALAASGPSSGGPKDPTGNAFPSIWVQNGGGNPPNWFNQFQNIVIKNCHISGYASVVDMGANNSGQSGMVFEDNIISNAVMYGARVVYTGVGTYTGPYVPLSNLFNGANGNSWRRNRYEVWPGSAAWDAAHAAMNGWFVWPDGDVSLNQTTDWHN